MSQTLSAPTVRALCRAGCPLAVEVVAETGSTNADLLARLPLLGGPTLLAAERQTAGRGRAGRVWHSEAGASLTFSLAWPFPGPAQGLSGLTLAVGVALAEVLAGLDVFVKLKWPNDVLRDGRKLAGVLTETATAGGALWAVVGVGVNLALPEALEARIGHQAADAPWLERMDRNALLAALACGLGQTLGQFAASGFGPFVADWNKLHAYAGREVDIIDQGRTLWCGRAVGVDGSGRLLLETDGGLVAVLAGDVSLRCR